MSDNTPKTNDPLVAALLRERAGYVTRGMDERVAQVDEQLKARGYQAAADDEGAEETGAGEQPKERRTPPRRTAKG